MRKDTLQAPPQLRSRSPLDNRPLDDYTDPDEYDPTYLQYATLSNTTASFPSARRPDKEVVNTISHMRGDQNEVSLLRCECACV